MKNLFQKMLNKFFNYLLKKGNDTFLDFIKKTYESAPDDAFIVKTYRAKKRKDFELKNEFIKVKKGRARYYLLFIETAEGLVKFTFNRHYFSKDLKRVA